MRASLILNIVLVFATAQCGLALVTNNFGNGILYRMNATMMYSYMMAQIKTILTSSLLEIIQVIH